MTQTTEEMFKAAEDALAEAATARAEAEALKSELAELKGKKVGEGVESSKAVIPIAAASGRPRGPINYPQLTRTNYTLWAMQMRVALQSAGVWAAVHSENVDFETDRDALLAIYQGVPEDVLASLAGKDTAKSAWDAIKAVHVGHDRVRETNLQTLRKAFEALEMGDAEPVDTFATRLNKMVSSIRALGDEVKELTVVQKILQAAPARFLHLVTSLEQCVDLKTLTVEDLFGRFKAHEERIRLRFGDPVEGQHLLLSKKQWENFSSKKSGGVAESSSSCEKSPGAAKGEKKKKHKFKCYKCGDRGHFAKECTHPRKEEAMFVAEEDEEPALLLATCCPEASSETKVHGRVFLDEQKIKPKLSTDERYDTNIWYLDTGASNHMTGCLAMFTDLDKTVTGGVKFGDGSVVEIAGRGTVLIPARSGAHKGLTDVYYIPKLCSNIISLGQMDEHGCKVVLEDGFLKIFDQKHQLLMKVPRNRNRLYILKTDEPASHIEALKHEVLGVQA